MVRRILLVAPLVTLLASRAAWAQCAPVTPEPCPDCFAVFVMPDTQGYVDDPTQPAGGNHIDLVTRYICQHRSAWVEPSTGKTMPIVMVVHLGDLVQHAPDENEWQRIDAAFDNLDACTPHVPYVVTNGNHDVEGSLYYRPSTYYGAYFGPDRWTSQGYGCSSLDSCDFGAGQYFLGGGDTIAADSRNHVGSGPSGPAQDQVGRHRAAMIETPSGQPFLFLGLEQAFDFPPAAPGQEGIEANDAAWPRQVLEANLGVPTLVFHHSMLWTFGPGDPRLRWGPETFESDSISDPVGDFQNDPDGFALHGGMEDLYELLVEPFPQVRFLFTGHVYNPYHLADFTIPRSSGGPSTWAFLRNFQTVELGPEVEGDLYGVGWNVIAAFDPAAEEVRVRSYRIDDLDAYAQPPVDYDHDGDPAPTECFDTDQGGVGERVLSWDFTTSYRAPSLGGLAVAGLAAAVLASALWCLRRRLLRRPES